MTAPLGLSAAKAMMQSTGCARGKSTRKSTAIDQETKRLIDAGYRRFWARRGRDVASFGYSGTLR